MSVRRLWHDREAASFQWREYAGLYACISIPVYTRVNIELLRSMPMETRCCKVCFENPQKKKSAEDTLVPPLREKREKKCYYSSFVHAAVRGGTCAFTSKNCQHADQKQLTRRLTFDLDIESTNSQPASCRARPMNGRCRPRRYRVDP